MKYIKNGKLVLNGTIRECDLQDKINAALEIIIKKDIDIFYIKLCFENKLNYHNYNHYVREVYRFITKKEHDLLKEILQ